MPLDGQTNGKIRVLDQQVALGFTHLFGSNKVLDARLGLDRTKAGKFNLSIGNTAFNSLFPACRPATPWWRAACRRSASPASRVSAGRARIRSGRIRRCSIPKVNFTWVKGKHSLKFGYEYEHIWMAVNDNNPLYGSFTYGGGYSACPQARLSRA